MKRRLGIIAAIVSLGWHAGLFLFFWQLHSWSQQEMTSRPIKEGGGVTWLNINPGGFGTGGSGGQGAPVATPLQETSREPVAPTPPEESPPPVPEPPKPQNLDAPKIPQKVVKKPVLKKSPQTTQLAPEKSKKPTKVVQPTLQAPKNPEAGNAPVGLRGPGEGEGSGAGTGPGGGTGQGLGAGKGAGVGSGKDSGGQGALGTGGKGSGGDGAAVLAKIRRKIMGAKRFPERAREAGAEGTCGLLFKIGPDGSVDQLQLTKSCGNEILDQEALATVRRAAPYPYYAGPIRFSLRYSLKD